MPEVCQLSLLLNSGAYDASFIAGIPVALNAVERNQTFAEHGFEMNKATAHGLIKRQVCLTWLKMFSKRLSSRTII